ncbi:hypothetical protein F5X97DRAFT_126456 [Nemania serpens]|nr:hypothetical protein F5X97DRAFT_126456 [Nemania serpens]
MALFASSSTIYSVIFCVLEALADFRMALDKRNRRVTVPPMVPVMIETFFCVWSSSSLSSSLESSSTLTLLVVSSSPASKMRRLFLLGVCGKLLNGFTVAESPVSQQTEGLSVAGLVWQLLTRCQGTGDEVQELMDDVHNCWTVSEPVVQGDVERAEDVHV